MKKLEMYQMIKSLGKLNKEEVRGIKKSMKKSKLEKILNQIEMNMDNKYQRIFKELNIK